MLPSLSLVCARFFKSTLLVVGDSCSSAIACLYRCLIGECDVVCSFAVVAVFFLSCRGQSIH